MNAKEAKELSTKIREGKINAGYKSVMEQIAYEAGNGNFYFTFYDLMEPGAKKRLEDEGFKVEKQESGVNEYSWEITW